MNKKTTMENLARESHGKGGFNGAWLYAEKGEILSKGAIGYRHPENTLPITEDTIFQLASVSKQFTALALSHRVQKTVLYICALLLSRIQGYPYHLSRFHVYALVYCIRFRSTVYTELNIVSGVLLSRFSRVRLRVTP